MNNSTVYITNKSSVHDYSSASTYGGIRFVTSGNYPIFKTSRLQEEIIEALIHSSPDDFLLFSGSAAVSALAALIWFEMHGTLKALLWDRGQNKYILRVFVRRDLRIEIETIRDRLQGGNGRMVSRSTQDTP